MIRRLPIVPTILVLAAAGVMVALGIWQLGRAEEKAAMIALFEERSAIDEIAEIDRGEERLTYRKVRLSCEKPEEWQAVAGRNDRGQSGYAHRFLCNVQTFIVFDGPFVPPVFTYADIGWSNMPERPEFEGGTVEGVLVKLGRDYKVVATNPPVDGLQPLATPDPNDLPNNHLAYAGQWFFFALTALLVYGFAIRSRLAKREQAKRD